MRRVTRATAGAAACVLGWLAIGCLALTALCMRAVDQPLDE